MNFFKNLIYSDFCCGGNTITQKFEYKTPLSFFGLRFVNFIKNLKLKSK